MTLRADYDPATYGQAWAPSYDARFPAGAGVAAIVQRVAALAAHGPVLEFAIGTGRLALPLIALGVEVAGIDASPAMIAALRAKPGGAQVRVVEGDMAAAAVPGRFALVLLAFNTLFVLPDQDAQVACFANAARHLRPGGVFVLEAFVPDPARFDHGEGLGGQAESRDIEDHDRLAQTVQASVITVTETGTEILRVPIRYAWPAELDLMARLAGLRLRERHAGWRDQPFTGQSTTHVSVYERPA